MPVQLRATFFFEDTNKHGWSETIWSLKSTIDLAMASATDLVSLRRALLGNTASLTFVRVSDDLVKRDSLIYQVPPGDQQSRTNVDQAADIANASLVVRLNSTPLIRRTLYMRGFPDGINVNSGQYRPTPQFAQQFDDWMAKLVGDGWACRTKDSTVVYRAIDNIVQDPANGNVTITTAGNHGFTLDTAVNIKGIHGATQLNGSWSLFQVPTLTTFILKLRVLISPWIGQGVVGRLGYTLSQITDGEVRRISHRNAGRPFDSPVGRRKRRAVR